jgi:glycosyltransferase involved in cell wall biosynthesis
VSEAAEVGTPAIGYNVCGLVDSVAMSGGHVVEESPAALAEALRAFFDHELTLTPRVPTQTWQEVGDAVDDIIRRVHAAAP